MPAFVSVIVPVRNEAAFIGRALRQLLSQNYYSTRFEVLVVDGKSTDDTHRIVSELLHAHANLKLLPNPQRLSSAARNIGIRQSQGEYIVIIDGHTDIDNPNYLRDLADAFDRSGADCLGRPQPLDVAGAKSLQRAIAAARSSWLGHHPASFIYSDKEQFVPPQSVAVAYRQSVFDRVGLFDETFDACEDVEFNHRVEKAGLSCFFTPRIGVRYHPRASLAGLFRQLMRYGRGRIRLLKKHPDTLSVGSLVPAAFVAAILGGALASGFFTIAAVGLGAMLMLYMLILLGVSLAVSYHIRQPRLFFWLPWVYLTIHLACGTGTLCELARVRRR
jgi:succinoglycan biosynthesis protein ExoA